MQVQANGVTLEYETLGRPGDPTALLIMGLGAQLTFWPWALVEKLVERGFFVVLYDNRDVGLSTKFDAAGEPDLGQIARGEANPAYSLEAMAADAAALLDALGVAKAHIVGASMGGMIAQLVASDHPEKTLSLTSIMSTSGNRDLPPPSEAAMAALTTRLPADATVDMMVDHAVSTAVAIGSPSHVYDTPEERSRLRRNIERSSYPPGFARQMAAIVANGDRRPKLRTIKAPTVVIHGEVDPLVPLTGGADTAEAVAGAQLIVIPGMGHDLPPFTLDAVADAIAAVAARASSSTQAEV